MEVLAPMKKSPSIRMVIGKWSTNVSDVAMPVTRQTIDWATAKVRRWAKNFPPEGILAENMYGVPSILASINCVVNEEGRPQVISLSPNPSNVGIATLTDSRLKDGVSYWISLYKGLKAVHGTENEVPDDNLWIQHLEAKEASFGAIPFMVRGRILAANYPRLKEKSFSPVSGGRSNIYGLEMGLWQEIDYARINFLPWNEGFALRHSSNLGRIFIYSPGLRSFSGARTEKRIETLLMEESGKMYVQKFIKPMDSPIKGEFMVYKFYFGFLPDIEKYVFLGGVWMSRKNLVVHGTPETTFGPILS